MTTAFSSRSMYMSFSSFVMLASTMSMILWSSFSDNASFVLKSSSCRNVAMDAASIGPAYTDLNKSSSLFSLCNGRKFPRQYSAIVSKFMR